MSRRLFPTLADYVVVAINPALIMGLVGSLVYFLLEVFYHGQYPEKLHFCLSAFVFASVLVSRIAMEEGFQHAAPFGAALAVVVGLALMRFVDYSGTVVQHFAWLINWGLMALIWWCAHQLTWDCTSIDDSEEAQGRGLLETAGLDPAEGIGADSNAHTTEATSQRIDGEPQPELPRTGWQQLMDQPGKPHTPGVWVVYFSLASLPIFGVGQAFIPEAKTASRQHAFIFLCVYVACGLGLLLTTSFLGLRRYLRQRRLEMPWLMVGNWMVTGTAMIVVLLLLTALLPRPAPEFAISELPWQTDSPENKPSSMSVGSEGVRDPAASPDKGVDHSQDQPPDGQQQSGGADTSHGTGQSGAQSGQSGQSGSGGQSSGGSGQSSGTSGQSSGNPSSGNTPSEKSSSQPQSSSNPGQPPQDQTAQTGQPQPQSQPEQPAAERPKTLPGETTMPPPPPVPPLGVWIAMVTQYVKYFLYGAIVVGLAVAGWYYREEVIATIQAWIEAIRQFWRSLFSGRHFDEESEELERLHAQPHWSFADFTDPFAQGTAGRYGAAELVKYTFAALQVWGREQGCEREPDQTPYEFAQRLALTVPAVADHAKSLAGLYGRAVYSTAALPMDDVAWLAVVWRLMRANPAPQPVMPE